MQPTDVNKCLLYLEVWCLSLIDDKPHQDVELLVKREGLPTTDTHQSVTNVYFLFGKP